LRATNRPSVRAIEWSVRRWPIQNAPTMKKLRKNANSPPRASQIAARSA